MNTLTRFLLILASICASFSAHADVTVTDKTLQKGIFSPPSCNGALECLCEADIHYPVIAGMIDADKQGALNDEIRKSAEQLACKGEPVKGASKGNNFSIKHNYEVTFQSQAFLSLKFKDWAYEGGAHGNGMLDGVIIDLKTGKVLSVDDIFGKNQPAVSQAIYDVLAPRSEGIFRDEVESRKTHFVENGRCNGCTLVVTKEGVSAIFQEYEVAPFADGNPVVPIPAKFIAYPGLATTAPAKK